MCLKIFLVIKFRLKKLKTTQISVLGSSMLGKTIKDAQTFWFSYLVYSQTWVKCLMDDGQFSYITQMRKKNTVHDHLELLKNRRMGSDTLTATLKLNYA